MQAVLLHIGERRPYAISLVLAAFTAVLTGVVAVADHLPIRDPDGIAGSPAVRLTLLLVLFASLDIVPRALWRARRRPGTLGTQVAAVVRERWSRKRLLLVLAGLLSFYVCYVGYRNLKAFLPFVRPELHDAALLDFDAWLFAGHEPAQVLRDLLGTRPTAQVLSLVYVAYLLFVPLSLGVALVWSGNVRRGLWYATALNLNWLLGAASYYLLPTLGPAYAAPERYVALPDTAADALQDALMAARMEVLAGPHATDAMQSIAGFASLHVSVVLSAALLASLTGAPRWLRVSLWTYTGLVSVSTMYFGWHYLIDDVGGVVIGFAAFWLGGLATGHDVGAMWRARVPALAGAVNVPNAGCSRPPG